jgi:hypothetical protein
MRQKLTMMNLKRILKKLKNNIKKKPPYGGFFLMLLIPETNVCLQPILIC